MIKKNRKLSIPCLTVLALVISGCNDSSDGVTVSPTSVEDPVEDPIEEPVEESTEEPVEDPIEESTDDADDDLVALERLIGTLTLDYHFSLDPDTLLRITETFTRENLVQTDRGTHLLEIIDDDGREFGCFYVLTRKNYLCAEVLSSLNYSFFLFTLDGTNRGSGNFNFCISDQPIEDCWREVQNDPDGSVTASVTENFSQASRSTATPNYSGNALDVEGILISYDQAASVRTYEGFVSDNTTDTAVDPHSLTSIMSDVLVTHQGIIKD